MRKQLLASSAIVGLALLSTPAFAQDAAPQEDQGEEILVTGSRIPQPNLESTSPVTVIGAAEVKQSGTTRVEDLVNALPQVFAGQGGSISNGSTGTATIDLRNLGAARTLVLINGRRLVPGDPRSPLSDVNIIPAALIKRVDVLTGGASSVYGADAVTGVVNFVMDTDFEGVKIDSQYSFYNHNNRAGGDITRALDARGFPYPDGSVTDGGTFDITAVIGAGTDDGRGHVTAYAGYRKINPVTQDKRDYSACSLSANTAANTSLLGRQYNCGGSGTSAPGSFYAFGTYYFVQGNQFVPGQVLYNFAPTNYFQRPDERYTAGLFAHYEVNDSFKPYLEFMFMDDRTVAQIAPSGNFFNTNSLNCDNPLMSAQQIATLCVPGNTFVGPAGETRANVYIGRRNVEGGGRQDDLQHTTYRGLFGARGDIASGITYDASYQYSRVNFAQTYRNDFAVSRIAKSLDVVSGPGGVPTCRSVIDGTDPACVPWNIFTTGGVSQASLNYLQLPLFSRGQTSEQIVNASITVLGGNYGATLPWATEGFAVNFGAEYRRVGINFEVDSNFLSGEGAGQGGPTTPVAGTFEVKEGFIEGSLPLVQGKSFFEDLRLGAGYRRSSYKVAGLDPATGVQTSNQFDTDTWKVEGSWSPTRDVKFRVSYNHSVRAPNAVELFGARSFGLDGSTDPCAGPAVGGTVNGFTQAQCALTGVTPAQFGNVSANPAAQYNGFLGGNAQLTPEIADSLTIGAVFTPTFFKGFQATIDFFDIRLKNQISTYGSDSILNQCLTTGNSFYCSLIKRNAAGNLWRGTPTLAGGGYVFDVNVNAGELSTRGVDIGASYSTDLGGSGSLAFSIAGTWLDSLRVNSFGPPDFDCVGFYGSQCGIPTPEWRHKARLTYTAPFGVSASLAWRYFSKTHADTSSTDTDLAGVTRPGNATISAYNYFDLALTASVGDNYTFRLGANNILDKAPPTNGLGLGVVMNGNTFAQVYDSLGRYVYVGVTLDF
ncbi:TonB-dependent receptor [Sphingomonas sp. AOB5]|uniref:TonB-dependent receptor domain-containing protein n=1 Tax=Sphingomonas sp. AOB5 TaxID=3034017 RepID=UPI0023F69108|nr:TonB-dependent receptor [Sphingomonas sp. AOB5]MDF7775094.1 TonB-dependent receptor [Sphingomonas sp. AOB5]